MAAVHVVELASRNELLQGSKVVPSPLLLLSTTNKQLTIRLLSTAQPVEEDRLANGITT